MKEFVSSLSLKNRERIEKGYNICRQKSGFFLGLYSLRSRFDWLQELEMLAKKDKRSETNESSISKDSN